MVFLPDQVMLLTCIVYLCDAIGDKSRWHGDVLLGIVSEETLSAQLSGEAAERHAAAGHLTADRQTLPLAKAAEGWSRCVKPLYRRAVLIP
jgi:hypothetical protein